MNGTKLTPVCKPVRGGLGKWDAITAYCINPMIVSNDRQLDELIFVSGRTYQDMASKGLAHDSFSCFHLFPIRRFRTPKAMRLTNKFLST